MFGWFFKRKKYMVLNFLRMLSQQEALEFDMKAVFELFLHYLAHDQPLPNYYEINYRSKNWKTKEALWRVLDKKSNRDVVYLSAGYRNNKNRSSFVFSSKMLNTRPMPKTGDLEFQIAMPIEQFKVNALVEFLKSVNKVLSLDYGYGIQLDTRHNFITERKDNTVGGKENSAWRMHLDAVNGGFIKNIQELNLLNESHLKGGDIAALLRDNIGRRYPIDEHTFLWELSPEELKQCESRLSQSKYLIANVDRFLSAPESKEYYNDYGRIIPNT